MSKNKFGSRLGALFSKSDKKSVDDLYSKTSLRPTSCSRSRNNPSPISPQVDTADAQVPLLRGKFGRFRILIIGRANAGKTTILQKVCNTTELPELFDSDGEKVCTACEL